MRYWAAPMLPDTDVVVGDELGVGLGDCDAAVDEEHAVINTSARTRNARLT